jgi:XTP/dITP diphosphohydrolase
MDLLLATRNPHKTSEFAAILGNEFQLSDLSHTKTPVIEETGKTFAENAILKATAISQDRHLFVVADDSGLEVDALDGAPGIFSARYAGRKATDQKNLDKLLKELARKKAIGAQRSARFRCVIALARGGRLLRTFEGVVEGMIVDLARGRNGFGYDPIFVPNGYDKTFGELPAEVKNQISHRAKAVAALRENLRLLVK